MPYNYETPYTGITERTATTLDSDGMTFAGVTEDGNGLPLRTDFDAINDAIRAGNILDTSTTFYVKKTGNDTTGDGTISAPWLTVGHAIDVVNSFALLPGVVPTIQIGDGVFTLTSSIDTAHPGTVITGENTLTLAVTSIQSSTGSAGAYSIVLNVDDVTDIIVTDECAITGCSGGTSPSYLAGTWDITNVDAVNSRITVTSTNNVGVPSGVVTATLTIYKTVLAFTGVSGIVNVPISVTDLALVGDGTPSANGIDIASNVSFDLNNVSVRKFGGWGLYCRSNGSVDAASVTISGNGSYGIVCQYAGSVDAASVTISGNGNYGIYCQITGSVYVAKSTISGNGNYGIYCQLNGTVYAAAATISGTNAIYAAKYGYINVASASITGTVSPALNTQGNEFGYIDS